MKLGLDVSGGDHAPAAPIQGAYAAIPNLASDDRVVLLGDEAEILKTIEGFGFDSALVDVVHAPETIAMGEHPAKALIRKPDSSLAQGFALLKAGSLQAFSSCGNTGAMLVGAVQILKPIPGVIRPCIGTLMPKLSGGVGLILDVGTNADCKPEVLEQFGLLGSLYAEHVYRIASPKVGLLNIGEEPEKGNVLAQAAHQLMAANTSYHFIGNVEGRDLLGDKADVFVCDGFTGNIILKEAEAFYTAIRKRGIRDAFFDRFNYEIYGGTPILGIASPVLIGHGMSSPEAIKNMLLLSKEVAASGVAQKISKAFPL
jgi:glycerol-3-phosphate acyltransferase PlsX